MRIRHGFVLLLLAAGVFLNADSAWAVGFELGESKEELGLEYEVATKVHDTGRVSVNLTIEDQGKLKPLQAVRLCVPSDDGTGYFDLSVSLATREGDGELRARAHMSRALADRAYISLDTRTLDGEEQALTWFYHRIPLKALIAEGEEKEKENGK